MPATKTSRKPNRFWLFAPFVLLVIVIAAWTVYWFIARSLINQGIDDWIAAERERGADIEYASRTMGGYPFRFELDLSDPVYAGPGEPRWEGERLRLVMQAWNWQHVIGFSPGRNVVSDGYAMRQVIDLDSKSAFSLSWDDESVRRIGLQLDDAALLIEGEEYAVRQGSLNLAPRPGAADDLMIAIEWQEVRLPTAPADAPYLGDTIGPSRLIGEVRGFFPAWANAGGDPDFMYGALVDEGGAVELAQLLLDWGPLDFGAKGELDFSNSVNGNISLRIENADALKDAMQASGHWSEQEETAVTALATASADGKFLTFSIRNGEVWFGPLKLATLPEPGL